MSNFSERLREERERLGKTQVEMGEIGGVRKQSQHLYEKGERAPDSNYLEKVCAAGVDVTYLFTGAQSSAKTYPVSAHQSQALNEGGKVYQLDSRSGLTQAQVMMIVLDALHELKRTLPAEKVMALVDAMMAFQRAGMGVDKVTLMEQLQRVK